MEITGLFLSLFLEKARLFPEFFFFFENCKPTDPRTALTPKEDKNKIYQCMSMLKTSVGRENLKSSIEKKGNCM